MGNVSRFGNISDLNKPTAQAGALHFDDFKQPTHVQPVESEPGDWEKFTSTGVGKYLAGSDKLAQAAPDEKDNLGMFSQLMRGAGIVVGVGALLCGAPIMAATAVLGGLLLKSTMDASIEAGAHYDEHPEKAGRNLGSFLVKHTARTIPIAAKNMVDEIKDLNPFRDKKPSGPKP